MKVTPKLTFCNKLSDFFNEEHERRNMVFSCIGPGHPIKSLIIQETEDGQAMAKRISQDFPGCQISFMAKLKGRLGFLTNPQRKESPMKIIPGTSHLDHGLTPAQVEYIKERFADKQGFFIETLTLPENLGTVPCGLHGPLMGDEEGISGQEIWYEKRGDRKYYSRVCLRKPRQVSQITVIAGPTRASFAFSIRHLAAPSHQKNLPIQPWPRTSEKNRASFGSPMP